MEMSFEKKELMLTIAELKNEGLKQKDIAAEVGKSPAYVSILMKELASMNMTRETIEDVVHVPVLLSRRIYHQLKEFGNVNDVLVLAALNVVNEWGKPTALQETSPQVIPSFDVTSDALEDLDDDYEEPVIQPEPEEVTYGKPEVCPGCGDSFGLVLKGSDSEGSGRCTECTRTIKYFPNKPAIAID